MIVGFVYENELVFGDPRGLPVGRIVEELGGVARRDVQQLDAVFLRVSLERVLRNCTGSAFTRYTCVDESSRSQVYLCRERASQYGWEWQGSGGGPRAEPRA